MAVECLGEQIAELALGLRDVNVEVVRIADAWRRQQAPDLRPVAVHDEQARGGTRQLGQLGHRAIEHGPLGDDLEIAARRTDGVAAEGDDDEPRRIGHDGSAGGGCRRRNSSTTLASVGSPASANS
jgi:hypothetical protein